MFKNLEITWFCNNVFKHTIKPWQRELASQILATLLKGTSINRRMRGGGLSSTPAGA